MTLPAFKFLTPKNNVTTPVLNGAIGAADTTIALHAGDGAQFPTISRATASSTGDARTLNSTGNLAAVTVGQWLYNLTDGSWAVCTAGGTNSVVTTPLEGGSLNVWTSGDIVVLSGMFLATITQFDSDGEIVKQERILVTNRATDTLTVVRGTDGDSGQAFNSGDSVQILMEEHALENLQYSIRNILGKIDALHRGVPHAGVCTGSADAYVLTLAPVITSYASIAGVPITAHANFANSGTATININGLGAKTIKKEGGATVLAAADISNNMPMLLIYNATLDCMVLVNAVANTPPSLLLTVADKTANYTLLAGDIAKVITDNGASAIPTITLITSAQGHYNDFAVVTNALILAVGGSDTIDFGSNTGVASLVMTGRGSACRLVKRHSTAWYVASYMGTVYVVAGTKGYTAGGEESGGTYVSKTDALTFSGDTVAASTAITAVRDLGFGVPGFPGYGYYCGGVNSGGTRQTTIYKFDLTAATWSTPSGVLGTARDGFLHSNVHSATKGYCCGGYTTGSVDVSESITKATDVVATITVLPAVRYGMYSGSNANTAGYLTGGANDGGNQTTAYKLTYSGETWSTLAGAFHASRRRSCTTQNGTTKFYGFGGLTNTTACFAFTIGTETSADLAAVLSAARSGTAGCQNTTTAGYSMGGFEGSYVSTINKLTYSGETMSTPAATLTAARSYPTGFSPYC